MDWANIINAIGVIIVAYFTYNQYTKNKVTDYKLEKWKEGYKRSIELSREYGLYRQNYCGCVYSR